VTECYSDVAYKKAKPTLFLDLEPSVKQRVGLKNELVISWRWER